MSKDKKPLTSMNSTEDGRIHQAEQAIVGLSGRIDGVETQLETVQGQLREVGHGQRGLSEQLGVLVSRTGGMEAKRGTVPITSLLAAGSLFLALVAIGMTVLNFTNGVVRGDMDDDVEKAHLRFTAIEGRMADDDAREVRDANHHEEMIASINEHKVAQAAQFQDLLGRIAQAEKQLADRKDLQQDFLPDWGKIQQQVEDLRHDWEDGLGGRIDTVRRIALLEAKLEKTWDEVADHEDEMDHPGRQTQDILNMKDQIKDIRSIQTKARP